MALGKLLELGGIDNRPPKTSQTAGKFRVARNVYPTPDKRIIPRYDNTEVVSQPSNVKCVHSLTKYEENTISLVSENSGFGSGTEIYQWYVHTTNSNTGGTLISFNSLNIPFNFSRAEFRCHFDVPSVMFNRSAISLCL